MVLSNGILGQCDSRIEVYLYSTMIWIHSTEETRMFIHRSQTIEKVTRWLISVIFQETEIMSFSVMGFHVL